MMGEETGDITGEVGFDDVDEASEEEEEETFTGASSGR
jgi:hypothetical protein